MNPARNGDAAGPQEPSGAESIGKRNPNTGPAGSFREIICPLSEPLPHFASYSDALQWFVCAGCTPFLDCHAHELRRLIAQRAERFGRENPDLLDRPTPSAESELRAIATHLLSREVDAGVALRLLQSLAVSSLGTDAAHVRTIANEAAAEVLRRRGRAA